MLAIAESTPSTVPASGTPKKLSALCSASVGTAAAATPVGGTNAAGKAVAAEEPPVCALAVLVAVAVAFAAAASGCETGAAAVLSACFFVLGEAPAGTPFVGTPVFCGGTAGLNEGMILPDDELTARTPTGAATAKASVREVAVFATDCVFLRAVATTFGAAAGVFVFGI
jgi:hypothetical protein